jgi:hypothetical protein
MTPRFSLIALALTLLSGSFAHAEVLIEWDWNNLTTSASPRVASTTTIGLNVGNMDQTAIDGVLFTNGGVADSNFICFDGWDQTSDYSLNRTDLSPFQNTISFNFSTQPNTAWNFDSLSMSLQRPTSTSPTTVQASIFWQDTNGQIQSATSGALSIGPATDWTLVDFAFANATAQLPTSGQNFHVEVYASGGTSGPLFIDNVALNGCEHTVIPEPGSALLIGCIGLTILARRRSRD